MGIAISSPMTPAYASLFMSKFQQEFFMVEITNLECDIDFLMLFYGMRPFPG